MKAATYRSIIAGKRLVGINQIVTTVTKYKWANTNLCDCFLSTVTDAKNQVDKIL